MSRRIRLAVLALGSLLAIVAACYTWGRLAGAGDGLPPRVAPDLSNHPIYSRYDFGRDERVVDIGMQPLWIPTNMITEVMQRDALLKKALSEQGLEVRFHAFLKGADVNFFISSGDLEMGIGGDMPALTAAAKDNVVVAALIQQGFCAIVARGHMLIDELRGKRIGYAFGSNAHYALLNTLSHAGLRETDVHLVSLDVNEMPAALDDGRIDAFSAWEPTPFLAASQYRDQVVIHRSLSSGYLYFSRSFANRHPGAAREIVAAELRAVNWMKRERNLLQAGRWARLAARSMSNRPPALLAEDYVVLAKNDLLGTASIPTIPDADLATGGPLAREFEFLRGVGMIAETAEWDRVRICFDRALAAEVLSQPQRYELRTYEYPNGKGEKDESD